MLISIFWQFMFKINGFSKWIKKFSRVCVAKQWYDIHIRDCV